MCDTDDIFCLPCEPGECEPGACSCAEKPVHLLHKTEAVLFPCPLVTDSETPEPLFQATALVADAQPEFLQHHADFDAQFARDLFKKLNPGLFAPSGAQPTRTPQPPQVPRQSGNPRKVPASQCTKCAGHVTGRAIQVPGGLYHPECFCCSQCNERISDRFGMDSQKRPVCGACIRSTQQQQQQQRPQPRAAAGPACNKCRRPITGEYMKISTGDVFHPSCFRCSECDGRMHGEFSLDAANNPICRGCSLKNRPKCAICTEVIPVDARGQMRYHEHPYWKDKYCPNHDINKIKRCASCSRLESRAQKHLQLGDGRQLCHECCGRDNLTDTQDCQELYTEILQWYASLGMPLSQRVPMMLVESAALNEVSSKEKGHSGECRGLTLTEIHSVPTIVTDQGGPEGMLSAFGVGRRAVQLRRHCEVTAILVLFGLPRLLTGAILAHECMHAWLRFNATRFSTRLDPQVEEGICQVMGYLWVEAQKNRTSSSPRAANRPRPAAASSSSSSSSSADRPSTAARRRAHLIDRLGKLSVRELKLQLEACGVDWRRLHLAEKSEFVVLLADEIMKSAAGAHVPHESPASQQAPSARPSTSTAFRAAEQDFTESAQYWQYVKDQIRTDRSPVYGEGFRKAWAACEKMGLEAVLEGISRTGRVPNGEPPSRPQRKLDQYREESREQFKLGELANARGTGAGASRAGAGVRPVARSGAGGRSGLPPLFTANRPEVMAGF